MAKLIFNKQHKHPSKLSKKYSIKYKSASTEQMAPKLLKLKKTTHFGNYPVPTGRILERYAYKHNLNPVLPVAKNLLSNTKLIGFDDDINRSKPKKSLTYHEIVKRYPGTCPCKDSDGDGVVNMADCRPFDKYKQDTESDIYDKHGNTKMPKEKIVKNISGYIPLKIPKHTIEVYENDREIEFIEEQSKSKKKSK